MVGVSEAAGKGVVTAIHVSPARGIAMRPVRSVVAERGVGLVGDRYHGSKHRHVSLQSTEDLNASAEVLGAAIDEGSTRRNITVSGFVIPTRPGERIAIGDVELEVVRIAHRASCLTMGSGLGPRQRCDGEPGPSFACSAQEPSGCATSSTTGQPRHDSDNPTTLPFLVD